MRRITAITLAATALLMAYAAGFETCRRIDAPYIAILQAEIDNYTKGN